MKVLGRKGTVVSEVEQKPGLPGLQIFGGTSIDDVRSTLSKTDIDQVFMGAGINLGARLEIVREIFGKSDTTNVHMKDAASGPEGLLPFVRSVILGLRDGAQTNRQ